MVRSRWTLGGVAIFGIIVLAVQTWSLDGVDGEALALILPDDTEYAAGYSDRAFRSVREGMTKQMVTDLLGKPLWESWHYSQPLNCDVHVRDGLIKWAPPECKGMAINEGMTSDAVVAARGEPTRRTWLFSWSPTDTHYRARTILFESGRVTSIHATFYVD
jgi:hypothetical protein